MGSWDQNQSILQLLVVGNEFLQTFGSVLFRIYRILDDIDDSRPLDFFLIEF